MSVFVQAQGIKTVHAGVGLKNCKILSTQLLNAPLQNSRCKFLSSKSNSNYLIIFSGRCLRTGPFGTPTRGILFKITSAGSCIQNGKKIGAYSSQTLGCKTCQRISPHFLRFVTYFLNQFTVIQNGRALPDITSGPEVRQIIKIQTSLAFFYFEKIKNKL